MEKKVIAVFGGSFNPPTVAHINLAKQILKRVENIEKVIFVPVSTKYNKNGLAPDEQRFNMLKCICRDEEGLEVSRIELDSSRQLYTIETLKEIRSGNPNKDIYFILGTDNLKELETWYKAEELISSFKILILKRDNDNIETIIKENYLLQKYRNSFIELDNIEQIDLSSSYIREKVVKGEDITDLVPEEIKKDVISIYKKESY